MHHLYLKNDIDWDMKMFLSLIYLESSKISENIDAFIECLERIKEKVNQQTKGEIIAEIEIPDDRANAFAKAMNDLHNQVFYNSLFIITTSFLEFSLTELCRIIGPYLKNPICPYHKYNNKEKGITKVKNYLKDTLQLNISENSKWSIIKSNSKIRNIIIHNSSNIIKDYEKKLDEQDGFKNFRSNKNLEITETGCLFINNSDYIRDTLKMENEFINEVYTEVKNKFKKKQPLI